MNNIIHRNQPQGQSPNTRKVIGMEKSPLYKAEDVAPEPEVVEIKEPIPTPEDRRATKRAEFSALEKSRKLEAAAKSKLNKAEELAAAYESKDIDRIAKANGMSTTDYVRWVNQKAIGAPTEKSLTPAEQVAHSAAAWQAKVDEDIQRLKIKSDHVDKFSYINKNILPHLVKDPDKYEFIHDRGADEACEAIYDAMNEHYLETGGRGKGEELDPVELLDIMEEQFMEEWKVAQEKTKKFKKLQNQKQEVSKPGSTGMAKTVSAAKGTEPKLTEDDKMAAMLGGQTGEIDEDALAESAPSNLIGGASRGSTLRSNKPASFQTGGVTPKNSKFSRDTRLAEMAKSRNQ